MGKSVIALALETVNHGFLVIQRLDELVGVVTEGFRFASEYLDCVDTHTVDTSVIESIWKRGSASIANTRWPGSSITGSYEKRRGGGMVRS